MTLKDKTPNLDKILATLKELASISAATSKDVEKIAKSHGKVLRDEYVAIAKELTHVGKDTLIQVRTKLVELKKSAKKEEPPKTTVKKKTSSTVNKKAKRNHKIKSYQMDLRAS